MAEITEMSMGRAPWSREFGRRGVGPGWRHFVDRVFDTADQRAVSVDQVKEKFGGLRIYVGRHSHAGNREHADVRAVRAVVDEVARESITVCEACGKPGRRWGETIEENERLARVSGGRSVWVKTLCDNHAYAYYYEQRRDFVESWEDEVP
jgi:hypothetical protein